MGLKDTVKEYLGLIKRLAKELLCPLQCLRFGIKNQGNLYIGKACKVVNKVYIILQKRRRDMQ